MAYIKKHEATVQRVVHINGVRTIRTEKVKVKGYRDDPRPVKEHPTGPTKAGTITKWDKVKAGNFLPVRGKKGKVINPQKGIKQRFSVDGYR